MDWTSETNTSLPRLFDAFGFGFIALVSAIWALSPEVFKIGLEPHTYILDLMKSLELLSAAITAFLAYVLGVMIYLFGYALRNVTADRELSNAVLLMRSVQSTNDRIWLHFSRFTRRLVFLDTAAGCFVSTLVMSFFAFIISGYSNEQLIVAVFSVVALSIARLSASASSQEMALILDTDSQMQETKGAYEKNGTP